MTPTEWAKLQGFANYAFMKGGLDTFSFPPSISRAQQYKQLGNSVTIPVIEEMAKLMISALDFLEGMKIQFGNPKGMRFEMGGWIANRK